MGTFCGFSDNLYAEQEEMAFLIAKWVEAWLPGTCQVSAAWHLAHPARTNLAQSSCSYLAQYVPWSQRPLSAVHLHKVLGAPEKIRIAVASVNTSMTTAYLSVYFPWSLELRCLCGIRIHIETFHQAKPSITTILMHLHGTTKGNKLFSSSTLGPGCTTKNWVSAQEWFW